ncbi:hypothetical protein K488DRAFT_73205 [Vararia minispora EC-137]|uniref:Uncharacterized protein n=1 Tax=Vararia minispora EC-137 TaxID=1314806 RepID=A0ACB8QC19_9AGAM|nr:hypothetical protein K488DRAFT_73205 [Vararia minispora EC-137]
MSHTQFFYSNDFVTNPQPPKPTNDFFESSYESVSAPSFEAFELDLDNLGPVGDDPSLQNLFNTESFGPIRDGNPAYGTPSVFSDYDTQTVSSVTASSWYSHSQTPYNTNPNPNAFSLPQQQSFFNNGILDPLMEFSNVRIGPDYGVPHDPLAARAYAAARVHDSAAYGVMPPSPPDSQHGHPVQRARSEYQPALPRHMPRISSSSSSYSPERVPTRLPTVPHVPAILSVEDGGEMGHIDSRRKHQCPNCPRAFARAFNLKTHMETHNPNRSKPYVCPHRSCARSFSRKHDLQRHRAAIHHDQSSASSVSPPAQVAQLPKAGPAPSSTPVPAPSPSLGVQRGPRGWCDGCGKSWVGDAKTCECKS